MKTRRIHPNVHWGHKQLGLDAKPEDGLPCRPTACASLPRTHLELEHHCASTPKLQQVRVRPVGHVAALHYGIRDRHLDVNARVNTHLWA